MTCEESDEGVVGRSAVKEWCEGASRSGEEERRVRSCRRSGLKEWSDLS